MKDKILGMLLVTISLIMAGCNHHSTRVKFYLFNATDSEIKLTNIYPSTSTDTTTIKPYRYFVLGDYVGRREAIMKSKKEVLNHGEPLVIIYEGQAYQINPTDEKSCLNKEAYRWGDHEELILFMNENEDGIYIFELTDEYIKSHSTGD